MLLEAKLVEVVTATALVAALHRRQLALTARVTLLTAAYTLFVLVHALPSLGSLAWPAPLGGSSAFTVEGLPWEGWPHWPALSLAFGWLWAGLGAIGGPLAAHSSSGRFQQRLS